MRTCLLTIITIIFIINSFGQSTFKQNDIYLEAGGNGLFGSVNYERQFTKEPALGVRFGLGLYKEDRLYLTIPVGINYLFKLKKTNSFIDAGLGATWCRAEVRLLGNSKNPEGESFVNFLPSLGYRKHTVNNVMWRISLTPIGNKYGLFPWLGVSIGKRF